MSWNYPLADGIVAVSMGVADGLAEAIGLPRDRISVVYNPVDLDKINIERTEPVDHLSLAHNDIPVILGGGRLSYQKDFESLIRAFAKIRVRRSMRLIIIGEGELRDDLAKLAGDLGVTADVSIPGFVANPYAYMSRATVFVLSSRYEGFANVLVEAMACGTAVISTNCPSGPGEILQDGRWGALVPVADVDALAAAIEAALDAKVLPDVKKRAGDFSVDAAIDGYIKALELRDCEACSETRVSSQNPR